MEKDKIIKQIRRLNSKLRGGRKWYQYIELGESITTGETNGAERAKLRTESFAKYIPRVVTKNDKVLDIGCNAGLFSLIAGQICRSVLGMEVDKRFIAQANFVKELWAKQNKKVSNVAFRTCDILNHLDIINDFDVILASKVLYHKHLIYGLHDLMKAIQSSKARAILAQGHTTQGEIGTVDGMKRLFEKYAFEAKVLENIPEYPIVLGVRK